MATRESRGFEYEQQHVVQSFGASDLYYIVVLYVLKFISSGSVSYEGCPLDQTCHVRLILWSSELLFRNPVLLWVFIQGRIFHKCRVHKSCCGVWGYVSDTQPNGSAEESCRISRDVRIGLCEIQVGFRVLSRHALSVSQALCGAVGATAASTDANAACRPTAALRSVVRRSPRPAPALAPGQNGWFWLDLVTVLPGWVVLCNAKNTAPPPHGMDGWISHRGSESNMRVFRPFNRQHVRIRAFVFELHICAVEMEVFV